jgi:hypothetical protein
MTSAVNRKTTWIATAIALCALVLAAPAAAGKKKPKAPPRIQQTEYAAGEQPGEVMIGAIVSRAQRVSAVLGVGAAKHELKMNPADASRTTLWTTAEAQGLESCLPVKFVAVSRRGVDIHREDSCVFGLSDPLPPSFSLPFLGLG